MRKDHPVKWQKVREIKSKKDYWSWMEEKGINGKDDHLNEEEFLYNEHKRNVMAEANNAFTDSMKRLGAEALYKAIDTLRPKQKEVIQLLLNQTPEREMARQLGVKQSSVHGLKNRAIKNLQKSLAYLKEDGITNSLGQDDVSIL